MFLMCVEFHSGAVDEMGELFNQLKEGGVSLIGQNQPITHDQLRRSFIRRNKNPVINEKVHTLRALQSTLKVRHAHAHTHTHIGTHTYLICINRDIGKKKIDTTKILLSTHIFLAFFFK